MSHRLFAALPLTVLLGACTWVPLQQEAKTVTVVPADKLVQGCQKLGEVEASVKDKITFYQRNDLKVRDELENLARNQAHNLQADTVQALGEPENGVQRFAAYRCFR